MFENVFGQDSLCQSLRQQLADGSLPRAILIHGPRFSAKLTTALELARGLQCEHGNAKWGCTCPSCTQHRTLLNPALLILGPRYFLEEISAATEACLREPREGTRYLVIRAVRKLVLRFEQVLWEGEEQKLGKALSLIESLEDQLDIIEAGTPALQQASAPQEESPKSKKEAAAANKFARALADISTTAEKLVALLPADGYSVGAIRRIQAWAHLRSVASRRVVILEDAERMNDSVRNSLLKLLEEPPGDFYCILLTSRLSGIIPTLRSRLRLFHAPARAAVDEAAVLEKIFRLPSPPDGTTLRTVLGESEPGERASLIERAAAFAEVLRSPRGGYPVVSELGEWFDAAAPARRRRWMETFLELVREQFRADLGGGAGDFAATADGGAPADGTVASSPATVPPDPGYVLATTIFRETESAFRKFSSYNTSARSLLEQVFFAGSGIGT